MSRTLDQLADAVGGRVIGDGTLSITGVAPLDGATSSSIVFFNNPRYREQLEATAARVVIVAESALPLIGDRAALVCAHPYLAFARIATLFHPRPVFEPGIDPRAVIAPGARVDPSATVMPFCYVARGAAVGPRAVLYPHVFVGEGATIGEEALLYPGVVVREACHVGARAILHSGAVLGADGFGFAFDPEGPSHFKIPQVGTVEVGADVEIGANTAVDRGAMGATVIGPGTKIDNLVQIGHNVEVGPLCILCGQVGIAGSAKLGAGVVAAGQVGIGGHLTVADRVTLGAQAGVAQTIEESGEYLGAPAMPSKKFLRAHFQFLKGPELAREVRELKSRLARLEAQLGAPPSPPT